MLGIMSESLLAHVPGKGEEENPMDLVRKKFDDILGKLHVVLINGDMKHSLSSPVDGAEKGRTTLLLDDLAEALPVIGLGQAVGFGHFADSSSGTLAVLPVGLGAFSRLFTSLVFLVLLIGGTIAPLHP